MPGHRETQCLGFETLMRLSADTAEAVMSEGGPGAACDLRPVTSGPAPECKQPHCDENYRKINTERQNVECQNVD